MSKVLLRTEDWVYLYSEIASVMQERFALDPIWEDQKDENGIIHSVRTPESEDTFANSVMTLRRLCQRFLKRWTHEIYGN